MKRNTVNARMHVPFRFAQVAALLAFSVQIAQANPTGANVINGQASFAASGNTLTVTNTPGTIIHWQDFSIGASEITRFVQQSAASVVLNRVVTSNPSSILGALQSNGRVFLVNPNGIIFGAGSTIDVAGMVATTLNLSNADFLAGRYNFSQVPGAQNISNAGNISAGSGGQIYLIAPNVENTGVITAPNGEILLAAGHSVELVNSDIPNLRVSIIAPAGDVTNVGQLVAESGSLGLFGTVVRNAGTVSADSATMQGGKIVFRASQHVGAGGTVSAQGVNGGRIEILADMQVGTVDVTGMLDASAPAGGNGGFIDTSAAQVRVADTARIITSALGGQAGTWLIDPFDFTIAAIGGNITGAALSASLGTGNVAITSSSGTAGAAGDVNVNDAVTWSANKLTLNAQNNININASLNGSGTASLALEYGQKGVAVGNLSSYIIRAAINLPAGPNFSTKLGSDGIVRNYTVITSLGVAGSTTAADLQGINGTSADYALGADIDAAATSGWNGGAGFTPLVYWGQFAGLGHSIANLTINQPAGMDVGLFGRLNGDVSNLRLINVNVTGSTWVGGLAGISYGNITDVSVTGNVTGIEQVGGLVGNNQPGFTIERSSFSGTVTGIAGAGGFSGSSGYIGGLVGWQNAIVSNSYALGTVSSVGSRVGGLVAFNQGVYSANVINSYAAGNVTGVSFVGGLVGENTGTVTSSYWDITTSGTSVGVGLGNTAGATGLTTTQMGQQASFAGFDFVNTWGINPGSYPFLLGGGAATTPPTSTPAPASVPAAVIDTLVSSALASISDVSSPLLPVALSPVTEEENNNRAAQDAVVAGEEIVQAADTAPAASLPVCQ